VADQDEDRLAGTEDGGINDPGTADGTVSAAGGAASGGEGMRHSGEAPDGSRPASDGGPAGQQDGAAADAAGGPVPGETVPGENGAMPGRADDEDTSPPQPPPGLHRPAGFAAGSPQPDPLAYPGGQAGDEAANAAGSVWPSATAGAQPSPYGSYGDYPSYQEQGYAGYGAPQGYGQEQGYGEDRGYGQEQGYPPAEGYPRGYPPPPEYGEGQGYAPPGPYGDGPAYGSYGEGYGSGQPYPEGPVYGGAATGEGQPYAQDQGYGPARGYPAPPRPETEHAPGQHHAPGAGQRADLDRVVVNEDAPDQVPGSAGPGPYPPRDAYRWQPPPYEAAPAQGHRGPYDVQDPYGQPGRGRGEAGEAARAYGGDTAYPPRSPQGYQPPGSGELLAPLPAHAGEQQQLPETADDLTAEALLHGKRQAPGSGWRRVIYRGTGGLIHPRESADAVRRRDLIARVRTPVAGGHHRVAVMSLKGGVGKTTTCVSLGAMLASLRGDRIIALDANPDRGTLSDKVRLETSATVRDLLNERDQIHRYADVRAFTSQTPSRLEVLASDRDPAVSIAFSEEDYYDAARVLEHFYSISLTDCGTGLLHSAMAGVLRMADQIVLVSSPSVDGARSASATLDWLDAHEYGDLVRNAVVVLSMIRPRSKSTVDLDRLEHHFAGRCRSVARIPYDAHLEEGAEVDLELMSPATVNAYLVLAATVGDGFAWPRRAARQPGLGLGYQQQAGPPPGRRYR
jgi:MinD-like ATPase involved in chromosome partitioning or flagellar assembly